MYKCKYCGKDIEKLTSYAAHLSNCKLNVNNKRHYDNDVLSKRAKDAAKRKRDNNSYVFEIKEHSVVCPKCGKVFKVSCSQRDFDRGKYRKYCSSFCSHSRKVSDETKKQISKGVKKYNIDNNIHQEKPLKYKDCVICGKPFVVKFIKRKNGWLKYSSASTCSDECYSKLMSIKNKEDGNGGFRSEFRSNVFKHGTYKNIKCDSSWELAFVVWNLEHNHDIKRYNGFRTYILNGVEHKFYPDFIVDNEHICEVKGIKNEASHAKQTQNKDISFLYKEEMKPYLDYCINKYGKNFTEVLYGK